MTVRQKSVKVERWKDHQRWNVKKKESYRRRKTERQTFFLNELNIILPKFTYQNLNKLNLILQGLTCDDLT